MRLPVLERPQVLTGDVIRVHAGGHCWLGSVISSLAMRVKRTFGVVAALPVHVTVDL